MKLLEEKKDKHFVVPAINFPWATVFEAEALGYSQLKAHAVGIKHEVEMAVAALREMHRRGIVVLPGGYVHSRSQSRLNRASHGAGRRKEKCMMADIFVNTGTTGSTSPHMAPTHAI